MNESETDARHGATTTPVVDDLGTDDSLSDNPKVSIASRLARYTAINPRKVLLGSLATVILLSVIGVIVGEFKIEVDNKGWLSRKTTIANRQMQMDLVNYNRGDLFTDTNGSVWEELKSKNSQQGFVDIELKEEAYQRRLQDQNLHLIDSVSDVKNNVKGSLVSKMNRNRGKSSNFINPIRDLKSDTACDATWYDDTFEVLDTDNLFAIWKAQPKQDSATSSILDVKVLTEICKAEMNTLRVLEEGNMCNKCYAGANGNSCLPPHSLVTVLRLKFDMMESSCDDLMNEYAPIQESFTTELVACTQKYLQVFDKSSLSPGDTEGLCPAGYLPSLVDVMFGTEGNQMIRFTSSHFSIFHFAPASQEVYDFYDVYSKMDIADGEIVSGTYDTTKESLSTVKIDKLVQSDMTLAIASLAITFTAMMIHTRSPWLTLLGIFQVVFAIPLAYFFYVFVARLTFFPFLNFIGVFVSAALGADDLFVAVDKFKNARIMNPKGSTADIAAIALPDAASAMLLTTSTTAVAFFATCICPVPPILCFAVYCGLMIMFNYVLNILFVFPGLCLYDIWIQTGHSNCCVALCRKKSAVEEDDEYHEEQDTVENPKEVEGADALSEQKNISLIHRILGIHYNFIHRFRWFVLGASIALISLCIWYSTQLAQPETTEVRLLPASDPFEEHFVWRNFLLSSILFSSGATVEIAFGIKAGDTGPQNNPDVLSKLLLDETFNPRTEESQLYLKDFCDRLFNQDFVLPVYTGYKCAINEFDEWLTDQSMSLTKTDEYITHCGGSSAVPVSEDIFDSCIIGWSKLVYNRAVLQEKGVVKIMTMEAQTKIDFTAPIPVIKDEWQKYDSFLNNKSEAPAGVQNPIHVSFMWWWLDTNEQMFKTALGAAAIAIGFSAVIVLISSRSFLLTFFSEICILYVLSAATATLVSFGWELGFLESVCFAILVGISCDFIIHFGHAYIHHEGSVDREVRTKFAVLHMGPSILAAAVTTFAAAVVMLFCEVIFFTKFAMILLVTIFHATIGSFVVYIVLNDLFGPSEPTKLVDTLLGRITGKKQSDSKDLNDLAFAKDDGKLANGE